MKPSRILPLLLLFSILSSQLYAKHIVSNCERAKQLIEEILENPPSKQKINTIRSAIELCPTSENFYFLLGSSIERFERTKKKPKLRPAGKAYRKAIELNPSYANAYFQKAGIDYLYGEFPKARKSYNNFLELTVSDTTKQDLRNKADEMIVKCTWLSFLPKGSIKFAILHHDYGKFDASLKMIGDVSMELGHSIFQATNDLGYLGAGLGVALLTDLITSERIVNYAGFEKAFNEQNHESLYKICKGDLANLVNEKGINHEDVQFFLGQIVFSGSILKKDKVELFPFANAIIYNSNNPPPDQNYQHPDGTLFFASNILGQFNFKTENYTETIYHYQNTKKYIAKVLDVNKQLPTILDLDYKILASKIKSNRNSSIAELEEVFGLLKENEKIVYADPEVRITYQLLISWLLEEVINKVDDDTSILFFKTFKSFVDSYKPDVALVDSKAIVSVTWANLLLKWGEYLQALNVIQSIEGEYHNYLASNIRLKLKIADIYTKVGKVEKATSLINEIIDSDGTDNYIQTYRMGMLSLANESIDTSIHYWNKVLLFHEKNPFFPTSPIVPLFTLWILDETENIPIDSIFFQFNKRLNTNFEKELSNIGILNGILFNFDKSNPRAQIAYSYFERALNGVDSDKAIQLKTEMRYNWMIKNKEYEKALRLINSKINSQKKIESKGLMKSIFNTNIKKQAYLLFKLTRYQECLYVLELSLKSIDEFKVELPDNYKILQARKLKVYEAIGNNEMAKNIRTELDNSDEYIWNLIGF